MAVWILAACLGCRVWPSRSASGSRCGGRARAAATDALVAEARAQVQPRSSEETAAHTEEIRRTLARERADTVSQLAAEERRLGEERRATFVERERRAGEALADTLADVERRLDERLAGRRRRPRASAAAPRDAARPPDPAAATGDRRGRGADRARGSRARLDERRATTGRDQAARGARAGSGIGRDARRSTSSRRRRSSAAARSRRSPSGCGRARPRSPRASSRRRPTRARASS